MKKAALFFSALFLFGCGAGGGTTTGGGSGVNTGGNNAAPLAGFTLKIVEPAAKMAALSTVDPGTTVPVANTIRVIARQIGTVNVPVTVYDGATDSFIPVDPPQFITVPGAEIYKKVIDVSYTPGTPVTVNLPVGDGYTIDVLTSVVDSSGKHTMLKFGTLTPVNIGNTSNSATITIYAFSDPLHPLVDIQASPDPITSEENYALTVSATKPLRSAYKVRQDLSNIAFANYSSKRSGTLGSVMVFTAPTSFVDGSLYFQGLFTIDDSMLTTGESAANWTRVYPNPNYGESVSISLKKVMATSIGL